MVDLQCCINFCCTVKWSSYTYVYILFLKFFFQYGLLQDIKYSSQCYTVGCCCLSIFLFILFIFNSFYLITLTSHSIPPPTPYTLATTSLFSVKNHNFLSIKVRRELVYLPEWRLDCSNWKGKSKHHEIENTVWFWMLAITKMPPALFSLWVLSLRTNYSINFICFFLWDYYTGRVCNHNLQSVFFSIFFLLPTGLGFINFDLLMWLSYVVSVSLHGFISKGHGSF